MLKVLPVLSIQVDNMITPLSVKQHLMYVLPLQRYYREIISCAWEVHEDAPLLSGDSGSNTPRSSTSQISPITASEPSSIHSGGEVVRGSTVVPTNTPDEADAGAPGVGAVAQHGTNGKGNRMSQDAFSRPVASISTSLFSPLVTAPPPGMPDCDDIEHVIDAAAARQGVREVSSLIKLGSKEHQSR